MKLSLLVIMMMVMILKVDTKCRIPRLGVKNYMKSDTIVSGTVMSFYMKESGGASGGRIRVRKVFKGDKGLEGRLVVVEGFGSKNICLSNPRLGDTKLFFLKMGKMRQDRDRSGQVIKFKLHDNILKINLQNLKTLSKLRDRRKLARTSSRSRPKLKPSQCDMFSQARPECIREPRAIKMINDAANSVPQLTPATLPLLPSPPMSPPAPPSPCSFAPCEEGGTCEEHDGTFTCHCMPRRSGRYCEHVADTRDKEAGFIGQSYIKILPPTNSVTRTSIELSFRTFHNEGIIILWLGHTDWMSISIVEGYVEVRYELGSGPAVLVASQPVTLGQWHQLVFRRYHRDGMLQIDGGDKVTGRGRGRNKSLNIKDNLYIGGHPYSNSSKYLVGTDQGLQGCVRNVKMMRTGVSLMEDVQHRHRVIGCSEHPCREGYCANSGQCQVRHVSRAPTCTCDNNWRGRRCLKKKKKKHKRRHKNKYSNNDTLYFNDKDDIDNRRNRRRRKGKGRHYRRS